MADQIWPERVICEQSGGPVRFGNELVGERPRNDKRRPIFDDVEGLWIFGSESEKEGDVRNQKAQRLVIRSGSKSDRRRQGLKNLDDCDSKDSEDVQNEKRQTSDLGVSSLKQRLQKLQNHHSDRLVLS